MRTDDGADLAYTLLGPADGPVVVLASGLLCPDTWWHHLAPALADEGHRVLLFHYRGIGSSSLPERDHPGAYTIGRYAADLAAVVDAEQVERFAVVGHSMGTQVALEAANLLRDRISALVLITGGFTSPIRTLYDHGEIVTAVYWPLRLWLRLMVPPVRRSLWKALWTHAPFLAVGRAVKAFGPRTDEAIVRSYVEHAASLDPAYVLRVFSGLHAHDAADLLASIDVPTMVIAGAKDPFAPLSQTEAMAHRISGAVLRTIPNGTHGAILEYPEHINGWVLDHLDAHALAAARAVRSG